MNLTNNAEKPLQGVVSLVTGGTKGWGLGIAYALKQAGAVVWVTGRDEAAVHQAQTVHGLQGIAADVSKAEDWDRVVAAIEKESGPIGILVNNAGAGGKIVPVGEQTDASIVDTIFTNLIGPMLGSRRIIPGMISRGDGVIVNISSACSFKSWPGWSIYSAAKAGLEQFARGLYVELRPHGIRVSTIIPAWGATEFTKAADLPGHPAGDPEIAKQCIQPSEMGQTVLNICTQPKHLAVLELTLLPLVQEICPL
jgi:NAD(P)-dependent dehydrogenase (short-subunit alcohol dehydrogenase family)